MHWDMPALWQGIWESLSQINIWEIVPSTVRHNSLISSLGPGHVNMWNKTKHNTKSFKEIIFSQQYSNKGCLSIAFNLHPSFQVLIYMFLIQSTMMNNSAGCSNSRYLKFIMQWVLENLKDYNNAKHISW